MSHAEPAAPPDRGHPSRLGTEAGIATGVAVLVVLLRILAIAGYDWDVAFAITHTVDLDDLPALMLGTLMGDHALAAAALGLLVPVVAFAWWRRARHRPEAAIAVLVLVAICLSLALTTDGWWVLPLLAAVTSALLLASRADVSRPAGRVLRLAVERVGLLSVVVLLVAAATSRTPWVPKERIETTSGVLTGWVLATDPGFLKVLDADGRHLLILRAGEVRGREELGAH